jgi:hypothetical protein
MRQTRLRPLLCQPPDWPSGRLAERLGAYLSAHDATAQIISRLFVLMTADYSAADLSRQSTRFRAARQVRYQQSVNPLTSEAVAEREGCRPRNASRSGASYGYSPLPAGCGTRQTGPNHFDGWGFFFIYRIASVFTDKGPTKNRRRSWTAEEDRRLLQLRASGRSIVSISAALRRTAAAVEARLGILRKRETMAPKD